MFERQGAKLLEVFESLLDSAAAGMKIMKPEHFTSAVVELGEQKQVMESRFHPQTPVSLLMKSKNVVFVVGPFWIRDSGCINISVSRAGCSI